MEIIAHIRTDFPDKFGVPRQSGLAKTLTGKVIFTPKYRNKDALRGIEEYSHLWLIWEFSEFKKDNWSPTVRPPRLGGNKRVGVFATRSPNRPNPIGLSSVRLERVEQSDEYGLVLVVSGTDMINNTPIYDIKPYLPYVDCHTDATNGFAEEKLEYSLRVDISDKLLNFLPEDKREALVEILSQDPRPSYQEDKYRIYGMKFADLEIKFRVENNILYVCDILKA